MAIKYRASWNTSENEALIQFDFIEDRGASGTAQVLMPRSLMSLSDEKQSEEAFRRFIEIHGSDFVTDERIKEQNAIAETTSKALLELTLNVFRMQSEVAGLKKQISDLQVPDETEEAEIMPEEEAQEPEEEPEEVPDEPEEVPSDPETPSESVTEEPDTTEEVPDDAGDSQDETEVNEETEGDPDVTEELPSEPADTPEETEEPNEIIDEV